MGKDNDPILEDLYRNEDTLSHEPSNSQAFSTIIDIAKGHHGNEKAYGIAPRILTKYFTYHTNMGIETIETLINLCTPHYSQSVRIHTIQSLIHLCKLTNVEEEHRIKVKEGISKLKKDEKSSVVIRTMSELLKCGPASSTPRSQTDKGGEIKLEKSDKPEINDENIEDRKQDSENPTDLEIKTSKHHDISNTKTNEGNSKQDHMDKFASQDSRHYERGNPEENSQNYSPRRRRSPPRGRSPTRRARSRSPQPPRDRSPRRDNSPIRGHPDPKSVPLVHPSPFVYLGNLPDTVEVEDLIEFFRPIQVLAPHHLNIFRNTRKAPPRSSFSHPHKQTTHAFVSFGTITLATEAINLIHGRKIQGCIVSANYSRGPPCKVIYIGMVSNDLLTKREIQQVFSQFGTIEYINVVAHRRCAFVHYTDVESGTRAVRAMPPGKRILGLEVRVSYYFSEKKRGSNGEPQAQPRPPPHVLDEQRQFSGSPHSDKDRKERDSRNSKNDRESRDVGDNRSQRDDRDYNQRGERENREQKDELRSQRENRDYDKRDERDNRSQKDVQENRVQHDEREHRSRKDDRNYDQRDEKDVQKNREVYADNKNIDQRNLTDIPRDGKSYHDGEKDIERVSHRDDDNYRSQRDDSYNQRDGKDKNFRRDDRDLDERRIFGDDKRDSRKEFPGTREREERRLDYPQAPRSDSKRDIPRSSQDYREPRNRDNQRESSSSYPGSSREDYMREERRQRSRSSSRGRRDSENNRRNNIYSGRNELPPTSRQISRRSMSPTNSQGGGPRHGGSSYSQYIDRRSGNGSSRPRYDDMPRRGRSPPARSQRMVDDRRPNSPPRSIPRSNEFQDRRNRDFVKRDDRSRSRSRDRPPARISPRGNESPRGNYPPVPTSYREDRRSPPRRDKNDRYPPRNEKRFNDDSRGYPPRRHDPPPRSAPGPPRRSRSRSPLRDRGGYNDRIRRPRSRSPSPQFSRRQAQQTPRDIPPNRRDRSRSRNRDRGMNPDTRREYQSSQYESKLRQDRQGRNQSREHRGMHQSRDSRDVQDRKNHDDTSSKASIRRSQFSRSPTPEKSSLSPNNESNLNKRPRSPVNLPNSDEYSDQVNDQDREYGSPKRARRNEQRLEDEDGNARFNSRHSDSYEEVDELMVDYEED